MKIVSEVKYQERRLDVPRTVSRTTQCQDCTLATLHDLEYNTIHIVPYLGN